MAPASLTAPLSAWPNAHARHEHVPMASDKVLPRPAIARTSPSCSVNTSTRSTPTLDGADHLLTRKEDAAWVAGVIAAWSARYTA
ncbi:MAG: hypothetical protein V4631_15455 [Pseudomonadota bacterium]